MKNKTKVEALIQTAQKKSAPGQTQAQAKLAPSSDQAQTKLRPSTDQARAKLKPSNRRDLRQSNR
jgi:hypothetical protein